MAYDLVWPQRVRDELVALDKELRLRVVSKAVQAADAPHHYLERMTGQPLWKLRIGDYRLLAEIDDAKRSILVLKVGHRKNIYK